MRSYFVTGTDTEVGKTFCCCALLHRARRDGLRAIAMKPVAAGAELVDGERVNEDALALARAGAFPVEARLANPYCLGEAIAPHVAAAREGVTIESGPIVAARDRLAARADLLLIEGVGGFRVPLGPDYDSADLAVELGAPLLLVVGLRLGCLNHALLTVEAIAHRGLRLAGWIGNSIDPAMRFREDSVEALRQRIEAPLLGVLPHLRDGGAEAAAQSLVLPTR